MADIADVARLAGVSTATVSRALNGKTASAATREKVFAAAAELGYVISSNASGLASGRTRHIGFMVPFIDRWFFTDLLTGIESVLLSQGYDVTLYDLQGNDSQRDQVFGSSLRRASIDGLIAASIELTGDEIRALRALGKPVVSIGGYIEGATAVDVDNARMATLATEHLLSLGHTRIAYVGAGRTIASAFQLGDARYDGWLSAMRAAGLDGEESGFWEADFDIETVDVAGAGKFHAGFWRAWKAISVDVLAAINGQSVTLVGHSLGSALAIAAALEMTISGNPPAAVYGFEPPRVSPDMSARVALAQVDVLLYRNGLDIVPMVPPDWRHAAALIPIGKPALPFPNAIDHQIARVISALAVAEPVAA